MSNEKYWKSHYLYFLAKLSDEDFAKHLKIDENDILYDAIPYGKLMVHKTWYCDICKNQKESVLK